MFSGALISTLNSYLIAYNMLRSFSSFKIKALETKQNHFMLLSGTEMDIERNLCPDAQCCAEQPCGASLHACRHIRSILLLRSVPDTSRLIFTTQ